MSNAIQANSLNSGDQDNTPQRSGVAAYYPSRKVGGSALAGAVTVVAVSVINSMTGEITITGEVASAITTILTFLVGYCISEA